MEKKYLSKYKFIYKVRKTMKGIEIKKFPITYISKYYVYFKPEKPTFTQKISTSNWNCYVEEDLISGLEKAVKNVEKETFTIYVLGMYDKDYTLAELKTFQEEQRRKDKADEIQKLLKVAQEAKNAYEKALQMLKNSEELE